jgi:hypothetical protein
MVNDNPSWSPDFGFKPAVHEPLDVGIGGDRNGNVRLEFNRPVAWIAMPQQEAVEFACKILEAAGTRVNRLPQIGGSK